MNVNRYVIKFPRIENRVTLDMSDDEAKFLKEMLRRAIEFSSERHCLAESSPEDEGHNAMCAREEEELSAMDVIVGLLSPKVDE